MGVAPGFGCSVMGSWFMLDLLGVGFGELLIAIGLVRSFMAFWLVAIGEGFVVVVYLSFGQSGLCGL